MQADIFSVFRNVSGGSFVSIDSHTNVVLAGGKKNPMQGRVTKTIQGASVMVFQNKRTNAYENMVKRRLEAEGKEASNFELGPRVWGTRIPNTPVIEHEKEGVIKHYLEVIFLHPGAVQYFLDNVKIDKADIIGVREENTSPEGQGGLENAVQIRTFTWDNITQVRIDGVVYN